MDFKINKKHATVNIPYARSADLQYEVQKSNQGARYIFQYKMSFVTVLLSFLVFAFLLVLMMYLSLEPRDYQSIMSLTNKKTDSSLLLDIDPKSKDAVYSIINEEIPPQNEFEQIRSKRYATLESSSNPTHCKNIWSDCEVILKGVRNVAKIMNQKIHHLHKMLVEQDILKDTDHKDAKFHKIMECLQCRNIINNQSPDERENYEQLGAGINRRSYGDGYNDIMDYFQDGNHPYNSDKESSEENNVNDSTERVPKQSVSTQVLKSVTNSSKVTNSGKITEILHNTTIIQKDNGKRMQGPTQVTRNMDATPIIVPTAETTQTSQQITYNSPQNSWQTVPVCFFYGPPPTAAPDSNSYQQRQQPFFIPGLDLQNQQLKFYSQSGQPILPQNSQLILPQSYQPMLSPPQSPQFLRPPGGYPMNNKPIQRNQEYFCTQIPAPFIPQQAYAQMPPVQGFGGQFTAKSKNTQKLETKSVTPKSNYDDSDEKYWTEECVDGFFCNPPYKKCLRKHMRCDGRVDCMGAEDEIGCPEIGYYSRFKPEQRSETEDSPTKIIEQITKTVTTYVANGQTPVTNTQTDETTVVPIVVNTEASSEEMEITTTINYKVPDIPQQFSCKRIIQTIPMEKRCNNVFDCEDTSDEMDCTCKDYLNLQHPSAVCDGYVDCDDGTDEKDCNFCNEDQYHCHRSGDCIPKKKHCNTNNDCKLNEDELDCFALSDGYRVNIDLDKRPQLNLEGIVTKYENGAWRPLCHKYNSSNEKRIREAGQKVCEYLGFKSIESAESVIVRKSKLVEIHASKDLPIAYEYPISFTSPKQVENSTCNSIFVRCKPILDRNVNVDLKLHPKTKQRNYVWPWEASIFVNGKYRCSAVLLENDVLMSSKDCTEGVDLRKNYTSALMGVASVDLPISGPFQQMSQVIEIKNLENSDAALFRLNNNVNITRYVQPLYLEKRIFPASKNESCVAVGVNKRHERKYKFLKSVVDNCPMCHRCYADRNVDIMACTSRQAHNNSTNWSGNVVCLSSGGWYPAAVFQDKDENCGFISKQVLNSIDYMHAHLTQAINDKVESFEEIPCEGVRCAFGECIPWDRVCDGIRDCRDGADESRKTCKKHRESCNSDINQCKCTQAEIRCGDGKCVPKEKFCNGVNDCSDGSDEPPNCTCGQYLKLARPQLVCDGRRHCLDKTDEDYRQCLCKDSSFKCNKSPNNGTMICIPQDFVCDGEQDCPKGEDESDEVCWLLKPENTFISPKSKGEVLRRTYGVSQSLCAPQSMINRKTATNICRKLGYQSGLVLERIKTTEVVYEPRNDYYMFMINNGTWMTTRDDVSFGIWKKPEAGCYRVFVHCFSG